MKKNQRTIVILLTMVIIISNLPPINYLFQEEYQYQNKDKSFTFSEQRGPTQGFNVAKSRFEVFKRQNPENPNRTLYRTFTLKPWRFWEWWQMIGHHERFTLPLYPSHAD